MVTYYIITNFDLVNESYAGVKKLIRLTKRMLKPDGTEN